MPNRDGHATTVGFALDATVELYEKEVQPPGLDGGAPVPQTTMRNTLYETFIPGQLIKVTEAQFTSTYKQEHWDKIKAMLNKNQKITLTFLDGSTRWFYGWLQKIIPNKRKTGEQPTAEVTLFASNIDGSGAEAAPGWTAATSTTTTTTAAP